MPASPRLPRKQSSRACCTTPGITTHPGDRPRRPRPPAPAPRDSHQRHPARRQWHLERGSRPPRPMTGALSGLGGHRHWERTVRSLPQVAHWIDGEPLDDRVVTLAKIEDRIRHYHRQGEPIATGVVSVGDAWACTGPHRGRGRPSGCSTAWPFETGSATSASATLTRSPGPFTTPPPTTSNPGSRGSGRRPPSPRRD